MESNWKQHAKEGSLPGQAGGTDHQIIFSTLNSYSRFQRACKFAEHLSNFCISPFNSDLPYIFTVCIKMYLSLTLQRAVKVQYDHKFSVLNETNNPPM